MPHLLENASVLLDSSDISTFVKMVKIDRGVAELDATVMGGSTQINYPGLRSWSMEITCLNNFASDSLDDVVSGFFENRTQLTISVKPSATAGDADNPEWSGSCFIKSYNPIDGLVGELAQSVLGISAMGALTRATATA